ncbi:glycosyltransferase WbuB [Halieaceae bacterium IMCC14734]|uniref:Glycosyltransferase WbuB n=2 Tax=Candidatus Litorirhabdus singularis TaxID=2518993 RepID=A0ABT3TGU6_9GAMM|nr:glycosyltransferase WbuB [Candidatus Litorirhabdus singularis]
MAFAGKKRRVLFIVENLPSPFDRRVWQEATTLEEAGYEVSIICPTGKGFERKFEVIDNIHIYRHSLPLEADGAAGYALEYSAALFWEFYLAFKVLFTRGFDAIHACNPPDLIFIVGGFFRFFFGKKFLFDHHDINPELYEAKFNRRDLFYKIMLLCERLTFKTASVSIATNESYKEVAIRRGGMPADRVHVVRSGPMLDRLRIVEPVHELKKGRKYLVGYVGVMGKQEGIDYLLRAAKFLIKDKGREDIHFGLVGGGTELENLEEYARNLGVADYVTFTGRVPDDELLAMLNTADVCVNPDVANEMNDKSTMNKIMEYMALAKPIVQFDLIEGKFSAGESSLYAKRNDEEDFAEKILQLLGDPELRTTMGEFGRNRVISQLEWSFEQPKLLDAYDQLFAS